MIKKIILIVLVIFVILQFIRPEKNESGYESVAYFEKETQPSEPMKELLRSKCYDCHSNQTNYPWYAEIAPVSFWINHHIEEGNEHFNVSQWESYSIKKKDHKLEELIEELEEKEMPLNSYTWLHGDLTADEREALIIWSTELRKQFKDE